MRWIELTVKFVRDNLRHIMQEFGLKRGREVSGTERWERVGGEISPCFWPDIVRRGEILGVVGIYVADFEIFWKDLLKKNMPKYDGYSPLVGAYITNFEEFIVPPTIDERNEDALLQEREWLLKIIGFIDQFPNNFDQLFTELRQRQLGPIRGTNVHGHRVRWLAFIRWLHQSGIEFPPELEQANPSMRIEPFEPIFRELNN